MLSAVAGVVGAFLLLVPLTSAGGSASDPGIVLDDHGPASAPVVFAGSVSETPDAVRLRIQASGDVEPGSVEIHFAGRKAVVLARDAAGRTIRSEPLRLPNIVVEQGSSAHYDADGALVVTFRKHATVPDGRAIAPP